MPPTLAEYAALASDTAKVTADQAALTADQATQATDATQFIADLGGAPAAFYTPGTPVGTSIDVVTPTPGTPPGFTVQTIPLISS